jgi:hypothetical protein
MSTVQKDLQMSDSIASAQIIKPTKKEKSCLSSYCALSLQVKKEEAATLEKVKTKKPLIKDIRANLLETLKESDCEILLLPHDLRKQADQRALSLGLDPIPPYIRLVKNNKDLSITSEIVAEAIASLDPNDVMENEKENVKEALVDCILASIRRLVRSYSEQIKLTESVPRCIKAADVQIASHEISEEAIRLHELSNEVLKSESTKRENITMAKKEMAQKVQQIEEYFNRGSITYQRVILENNPYNLCKRISVTKPKISFPVLTELLNSSIQKLTKKQDIIKYLENRDVLTKSLLTKISTIPSTTKVAIHLQKIKVQQNNENNI